MPALWWAARRFAPPAAALLAAALLAINPMAVWYSQMARPYAFVMLAACLAFGALPRALERGGRRAWAGYVGCDGAARLLRHPRRADRAAGAGADRLARRGATACGAGCRRWLALLVCCVPLIVAAVIARGRRNALYWLPKPDRTPGLD